MKTKLIDKSNGAVIEVSKELVNDYIGTGRFDLYIEKKQVEETNVAEKKVGKYVSKIKHKM